MVFGSPGTSNTHENSSFINYTDGLTATTVKLDILAL